MSQGIHLHYVHNSTFKKGYKNKESLMNNEIGLLIGTQ